MSIGTLPTPRVTFHNRGFRRGAGDTLQPEDTMADNDFVERLRIRWETMGDMANDERAAAATEIESLRHGQREMMRTIATLTVERDEARHGESVATATLQGCIEERTALTTERDEARLQTGRILNEIDCRIEHGAESNGHLEAIYNLFKENTND